MGAAGDMLMAALLELHENPEGFLERLNAAGIPGVMVTAQPSVKCGITGTHVMVKVDGREEHSHDEHDHDHKHDHDDHHHHHDHEHGHVPHNHDHNHEHIHHNHGHSHEHAPHNHGHNHHAHDHQHNHDHPHEHTHADHHEHTHSHGTASHNHEHTAHHHSSSSHIEHLIGHLNVSEYVKQNALAVYQLIAEAESRAHGVPISQVHFHEVGEMDAVADIVGVCMLIEELAPEMILSSPINVGSGHVRCSHGILPVPAPATAFILQKALMYSDQTKGELCTPTGAAILKHFASDFCKMPMISVDKLGYGMGTKDFEKANCVRAYIGEASEADHNQADYNHTACNHNDCNRDEVIELVCNLDDMTPEALSFAHQCLADAGALDVCITPIVMKKGRAGYSLTCMCRESDRDKMCNLMFKHTTTLGMREYTSRRYTLKKEFGIIKTQFGDVRTKISYGFGVQRYKPEHDDIAAIAKKHDMSIPDVLQAIGLPKGEGSHE